MVHHVGSAAPVWLYVNVGGVNNESVPEQFGNRPVFPSSFGNAGFGFEGTALFEVHGMWVLCSRLSLYHHSVHTALCVQSTVPWV